VRNPFTVPSETVRRPENGQTHRYAREFDLPEIDQVGFHREMPE
jgi:hypothetical protein